MDDAYRGRATLVAGDRDIVVRLHLAGGVVPIDGRFHWTGRIDPDPRLADFFAAGGRQVLIRTPEGREATGMLTERNAWGGFRVTGTGTPPFGVLTEPAE